MMAKIRKVRPVLLSAPYADPECSLEVKLHLRTGYRTCGLVEITLDDGCKGYGEGYLAVFAPRVFERLIHFLSPLLIGREVADLTAILRDLTQATGYWSLQGAAQHAVSAVEIALLDCCAKENGLPLFRFLGGDEIGELKLYASGGDSNGPVPMAGEIARVASLGIDTFKIRARKHQVDKVVWCMKCGERSGVRIAVDMTQNLAEPSQTVDDVLEFLKRVRSRSGDDIVFLEEALGPSLAKCYPDLRSRTKVPVAGGEIVTTASELIERIESGFYDIAQPDATVIGGITAVQKIFHAAERCACDVYVHCWGGPAGMLANYHAAAAAGARFAEWPLPDNCLRQDMIREPWSIRNGCLTLPTRPGLGVELPSEVEKQFPFRETAVYSCIVDPNAVPPDGPWV